MIATCRRTLLESFAAIIGTAFLEVPHDSESSTGGSGSGESLPEDAVLNPSKPFAPGKDQTVLSSMCAALLQSELALKAVLQECSAT